MPAEFGDRRTSFASVTVAKRARVVDRQDKGFDGPSVVADQCVASLEYLRDLGVVEFQAPVSRRDLHELAGGARREQATMGSPCVRGQIRCKRYGVAEDGRRAGQGAGDERRQGGGDIVMSANAGGSGSGDSSPDYVPKRVLPQEQSPNVPLMPRTFPDRDLREDAPMPMVKAPQYST